MPIRIEGVNATLKALGKGKKKDGMNIADALERCASTLYDASQKLVPVDTGQLKGSGYTRVKGVGMAAVAIVAYDCPYAFIVHERLDVHHAYPTQAKYLQDAIHLVRGTMTAAIRRNVGGTGRGVLAGVHGGLS